jgi:hypothetical protein
MEPVALPERLRARPRAATTANVPAADKAATAPRAASWDCRQPPGHFLPQSAIHQRNDGLILPGALLIERAQ